jgi:single-strand DNA-binding protein
VNINSVTISGNLTRDAEIRYTKSQTPVITFGVAVNSRVKVNNEWTDYANFFDCVFYGSYAEKCAESLKKGAKVVISGSLRWSQWQSGEQTRSKVEINVSSIDFFGQKSKTQPDVLVGVYDDDLPF